MILTKVASCKVYALASVMIIALGFVPKISTVFSTLPDPVIGGVYFATFGLILGIGVSILGSGVNLKKDRNLITVGLSIFLGIALPYYIGLNPVAIAGVDDLIVVIRTGKDGSPCAALIAKKGETQRVRNIVEQIKKSGKKELL